MKCNSPGKSDRCRPWSGAKPSNIRTPIDGQSCRNPADYCVMNDCSTLCVDGTDYTAQCTRMGNMKTCTRTCNKSNNLYCGGACIEIDRSNCGACGTTCADNQDCGMMGGQMKCVAKCGVDQQRCNGNCVPFNDRNNCGSCESAGTHVCGFADVGIQVTINARACDYASIRARPRTLGTSARCEERRRCPQLPTCAR